MPYDPLMRWEWEGGAVLVEGTMDEDAPEHVGDDGNETAAKHLRWGCPPMADRRRTDQPSDRCKAKTDQGDAPMTGHMEERRR